jgi:hypothetical protein
MLDIKRIFAICRGNLGFYLLFNPELNRHNLNGCSTMARTRRHHPIGGFLFIRTLINGRFLGRQDKNSDFLLEAFNDAVFRMISRNLPRSDFPRHAGNFSS